MADAPEIPATAPLPEPTPEAAEGATAAADVPVAAPDAGPFVVPTFESVSDLERWLRQRGGFSRKQAVAVVAEAHALFRREIERQKGDSRAILDALRRAGEAFRP